jgi:hypothetical protein
MAQVTITELPLAQALTGLEPIPIVQNGVTVQTTTGAISGAGALNYPFLTVGSTSGLTQARYVATNSGLTLTDNGAGSTLQINLTGAALSLNASGTGIQVKTNSTTVTNVSMAVGTGLSVANADGIAGNPTISLGTFLQQFVSLTGTGMLAIQSGTVAKVDILGTSSQISIANGNGAGNVTVSIADNPVIPGTGSITVSNGTTVQRSGSFGAVRYNTDLSQFEGYTNTGWNQFSVSGGVTSFSAGTTGFTPSTASSGAVTLAGTLNVANGGTGATTLTGYVYGNGTGAMTASTTIPTTSLSGTVTNAQLANSAITINGSPVSLGGSITVTATATNALTIGTGLSGTSYNGSTAVTIAIDSTVATLTGTQTLTNKSMSGSSNTFTNIPNGALTNSTISGVALGSNLNSLTIGTGLSGTSYNGSGAITIAIDSTVATLTGSQTLTNKTISGASNTLTNIANASLTNSSVTVGTTAIALGASSLTLGGLTSVAVTQDPTSALELATKQYVDAVAQGLDPKASCVAATTANITLSGTQTIDGVALIAGDRCLVKNQTLSQNNGIYLVAAGAWTRATDMDSWAEVPGAFTFIEQGTLYADTGWVCTSNAGGTLGTTPITWVQFAGVGSYTAGTGLTLTGTQFSLTAPVTVALGGTNATNATDARTNLVVAKSGTNSDITELYALNGTSYGVAYQNLANQLVMGAVLTFDGTTLTAPSGAFTTISATGVITSTVTTGTAPFTVASTTQVANLNAATAGTATNATNTGTTAATSGATNYLVFKTATSGNLPELVNSSITCNAANGTITGGIAGGAF